MYGNIIIEPNTKFDMNLYEFGISQPDSDIPFIWGGNIGEKDGKEVIIFPVFVSGTYKFFIKKKATSTIIKEGLIRVNIIVQKGEQGIQGLKGDTGDKGEQGEKGIGITFLSNVSNITTDGIYIIENFLNENFPDAPSEPAIILKLGEKQFQLLLTQI